MLNLFEVNTMQMCKSYFNTQALSTINPIVDMHVCNIQENYFDVVKSWH